MAGLLKDNTRSQVFTYDQLNRIVSGKTSASNVWGTNYTLDAFGNLSQKTPMAGMLSGENFSQTVLSNNRLAGFGYDAAGNTSSDGVNTYLYDAENEIVSAAGVTYTYDGNGDRVKKSNGRLYWYGAPGIVAESDLSGNLTAEYVFFDGERVARRDLPSGNVHYYFSDHLKSVSVVTSASGTIEEESDYRPWGEEKVITHTLADQHFKFNGKERDSETGFDEFGARLYSSAWSRWLTPDWSADPTPVPYAQMDNPQSLNLYEYALNNPTTLPDLDGHLTPLGSCCGGGQAPVDGQNTCGDPNYVCDQAPIADKTQGAGKDDQSDTANFYGDPGSGVTIDLQHPARNLDGAQNAVAAAGLYPPLAPISGLFNGVVSLARGNTGDAGANLAMAIPFGGMLPKMEKVAEETVSVYKIIEKGETTYVGITNNLERRATEHGAKLVEVASGLSRKLARGVEQALIEHHGLGKNGGTLMNRINSVSRNNPIYHEAVTFGKNLLQSLNYF